ncbi:nematocyst expressed protein 6-like [Actinia tenebrosa]|uniref:Metalloendopeptidase n=1 Tax=Actinia tenebrosa TaxID=6105 RepID=A0A6P8HXZ8_ACTTE|nr:nematocyst expressed protein 6-like [Actinia tenebrosa]
MIREIVLLAVCVLVSTSNGDASEEKHLVRRAAMKAPWTWPNAIVYYKFSRNLDNDGRNRLNQAMARIERKTCIRFRRRRNEPNYILMQYDFKKGGCKANVGFVGGQQNVYIANPEVFRTTGYCGVPSIVHELGHALGFFHEQSRPDRDNYVRIHLKNLAPQYKWAAGNFDKTDRRWVDDRGIGYDYGSLMHYGKYAFASRGKVVVEPLDPKAHIGQRKGLSRKDINQLKVMYNCR